MTTRSRGCLDQSAKPRLIAAGNLAFLFGLVFVLRAYSQSLPYPDMAPVDSYLMPRDMEISLARSSAPDSISANAEVWVLARDGYMKAAEGTNGFVCIVGRSWAATEGDPEFWNPKLRAPICYNASAARYYLPLLLKKTSLVLSGHSKPRIFSRLKTAVRHGDFPPPGANAMCYMMSKQGHLNDRDGHWHPHLMFFARTASPSHWGANLQQSPVLGFTDPLDQVTTFMVLVPKWSDGSSASAH